MNIIFNPPVNNENKYIEHMTAPLAQAGFTVYPLDNFLSGIRHFRSIKLVHLNWFENLDDSSYASALRSFFKKMIVLGIIKLSSKKLIWTMHNRMSHEKKTGRMSRVITKALIKAADVIIIHSRKSRELLTIQNSQIAQKIRYLPHPHFIESYGPLISSQTLAKKLKLLFLGAVKPYKNMELLMSAMAQVSHPAQLTIAGNPQTAEYKKKLETHAKDLKNVTLKLEFIPNDKLPALLGDCDLLILPYDLESSLNSGSVILAFSYQKTVICPEIGTLTDIENMKNNYLSYTYNSTEQHLERLVKLIQRAVALKENDPAVFERMGMNMYRYVKEEHSKINAGAGLVDIYRSLLDEKPNNDQE